MPDWCTETWVVLGHIWWRALLGVGLMAFACIAGWQISSGMAAAPVRLVRWWVLRVLMPILRGRSWLRRATVIYANNLLILTMLVACAPWLWAVVAGIAAIGAAMGIALRTLSSEPSLASVEASQEARSVSGRVIWGMALNMLEPPAIAVALGLALSYATVPLDATQLWRTFWCVVAPAMLLAAAGESLWMGAVDAFTKPPSDQHIGQRNGGDTGGETDDEDRRE